MKQVFRTQQGIQVIDVSIPQNGETEILVKVIRSMISTGTEAKTSKSEKTTLSSKVQMHKTNLLKLKKLVLSEGVSKSYKLLKLKVNPSSNDVTMAPIGYSVSGIVVSVGKKIQNFKVGDRVACAGSGLASHAEYVSIPKNLAIILHDNVSFDQAAFTTIGSIALQGLRRANVTFGDTIVVTGLGLIGLLAVQIAKAWGLNVIAIDIDGERISLAEKLGADYAFNANLTELDSIVNNITGGFGVDAVVICAATKSDAPVNQAMRLCRRKGTVTIVGAVGMNVERDQMYLKEIDLVMSTSYGPGRYDEQYELRGVDYPIGYVKWTENRNMMEFERLLSQDKINTETLINKTFKIDDASLAFKFLSDGNLKPIGALLEYSDYVIKDLIAERTLFNSNYTKVTHSKINVGIIGTGGFMQGNHLPNLKDLEELYTIHAICDKNHVTASNLAKKYNAVYSTTDYNIILEDANNDLIIIGTRHDLHAKLAIDCLAAGKHVLVEKPVAMTLTELEALDEIVKKTDKLLTAGFNRRYSPFAVIANSVFKNRVSPLMVTYRINAGAYPLSHWIHDPVEGGGRIIGEACHFLDFINFLIDKPLKDYSFSNIPLDGKIIQANDNISLNLSYSDGSVANLVYTSVGNKLLDKERIEIFGDYKTIVIDNFTDLTAYGVKGKDLHLKKMDKGFKQELVDFANVIKGKKPISLNWDSIYMTTKTTIEIMNKILD